ncbi:MAG: glycosyltransferase N-terminal domain-containing protein, partial [Terriglobia bacterium]
MIYNLLSWPAALLLSPWLVYRALRGRLPGLGQRLGKFPPGMAQSSGTVIWLHAVSLGEVKAAAPLLEQLRARHPQLRIVMTTS